MNFKRGLSPSKCDSLDTIKMIKVHNNSEVNVQNNNMKPNSSIETSNSFRGLQPNKDLNDSNDEDVILTVKKKTINCTTNCCH